MRPAARRLHARHGGQFECLPLGTPPARHGPGRPHHRRPLTPVRQHRRERHQRCRCHLRGRWQPTHALRSDQMGASQAVRIWGPGPSARSSPSEDVQSVLRFLHRRFTPPPEIPSTKKCLSPALPDYVGSPCNGLGVAAPLQIEHLALSIFLYCAAAWEVGKIR